MSEPERPNRLVLIGGLGQATAYLNVSKEEAARRYNEYYGENQLRPKTADDAEELAFHQVFEVYSAWETLHQDDISGFCDGKCCREAQMLIAIDDEEGWQLRLGSVFATIRFCPYCGKPLGSTEMKEGDYADD